MKRKKITKLKSHGFTTASKTLVWIDCKVCFEDGAMVTEDTKGFTCASCVSKMAAPPEIKTKPEEKRPRGWQFMSEYVSPSGKVYHKGREVDESVSSGQANVAGDAKKPGTTSKKSTRGKRGARGNTRRNR